MLQVRFEIKYFILFFVYLEKKTSETKETKLNGSLEEHDENSNASIASNDGHDNSGVVKEEITPKRNAQRTAKVKVTKYDEDGNEEDDDDIIRGLNIDDGDEESDYMGSDSETEKKIKKAIAKPKQPRKQKLGLFDLFEKLGFGCFV